MADRSKDWFIQAQDDLAWAKDTLETGHYAQACLVCQQSAEKAIKAFALSKGNDQVRSHSILEIVEALRIDGELRKIAQRLDQYYISTRYPDAFPSGSPYQYYSEEQAREALEYADIFITRVGSLLNSQNE